MMKTITHSEKMFLSHILSLAKSKGYCYARNQHFRDFSNYSERQVERILKHLVELKMIEVRKVDGLRLLFPLVAIPDNLSADPTSDGISPDNSVGIPDNLATIESKENKEEKVKKKNTKSLDEKELKEEGVTLLASEHDKLIAKYGDRAVPAFYEKLSNYKLANGKTYKSDYRAILGWVADSVLEKNPKLKVIPLRRIPLCPECRQPMSSRVCANCGCDLIESKKEPLYE